jgi:phosphoserine phosphatase
MVAPEASRGKATPCGKAVAVNERASRPESTKETAPTHVTAEDIVERLSQAHAALAPSAPVLAFDADGTLWSGDVGVDLFEALLAARAVRSEAHAALAAEARAFGVADAGDANEVAASLYAAHESGRYPEDRAFGMMAWAFAGFSRAEAIAFAERVVAAGKLDDRLHRFLTPVLAWAKREGVPVWVVSASPRWIVEIGVAKLGILAENVVAMEPEMVGGSIAPRLAGPPVYGEHKPLRLQSACPGATVLGAFGDSSYDVPLLLSARVRVAVRPKPGLLSRAADVPELLMVGV